MSLIPDRDNVLRHLRFRLARGYAVPYLEMTFRATAGVNTGNLPLDKVVIGPTLNPELADLSLTLLLRQAGYGHTAIVSSEVPLR